MSDNCSNHHKYNLFLQNSNNESFRKLLYGSSRETDLKACSMLSGIINCCERLNEQKILKSNDYSNYSDNENIRSARQLYKEKIKHPYFDKLQRTSSHLTQLLDAAKKDYRKVRRVFHNLTRTIFLYIHYSIRHLVNVIFCVNQC